MAEETKKDEAVEEATEEKKEEVSEDKKEEATTEDSKPEEKEEPKKEEPKEPVKADSSNEAGSEEKEEVEVPAEFKDFVEKIEKMTVVEISDLVSVLEKKFNVSAVAPAAAGGAAAGAEAKSEFNVVLKAVGDQKINVIKAVKEITGLGLKEAKDLVDGAPSTIKEAVKAEEAEEMKKQLTEVGATVELE